MEEVREIIAEQEAFLIRYLVAIGDEIKEHKPICLVEVEEWDEQLGRHSRRKKEWLAPFSGLVETHSVNIGTLLAKG
jgi:hypothetical protein